MLGGKTSDAELISGDCTPGVSLESTQTTTANPKTAITNGPDLPLPSACSVIRCAKDCTVVGCGWSSKKKLCLEGGSTNNKELASGDCREDVVTTVVPGTDESNPPSRTSSVAVTSTAGGETTVRNLCPYYASEHFVEGTAASDARSRLGMIGNVRSLELCANVCRTFLTGDQCKSFWYDAKRNLCDLSSFAGSISQTGKDATPVWLRIEFCEPPLEPPPTTSSSVTTSTSTTPTSTTRTTLAVKDALNVHQVRSSISTFAREFTVVVVYAATFIADGVSVVVILKGGQNGKTQYAELTVPLLEAEGSLDIVVPLPKRGLDAGTYSLIVFTAPAASPVIRKNFKRVDTALKVKEMPYCPDEVTQQFTFMNISGAEIAEQRASDIRGCAADCVGQGDVCSGFKYFPLDSQCIQAKKGVYPPNERASPFLLYSRFEYACFTKPPTTSTTTTSPPSTTEPPPADSVDVIRNQSTSPPLLPNFQSRLNSQQKWVTRAACGLLAPLKLALPLLQALGYQYLAVPAGLMS